jgi:ankyrin repeat protein
LLLFLLPGPLAHATEETLVSDDITFMTLPEAVAAQDLEAVKRLVAKKVDIDPKDQFGRTPLMEAAYLGNKDIVGALIFGGANIRAKDNSGETALMKAALNATTPNHRVIMQILLLNSPDTINDKNLLGETAFSKALIGHHEAATRLLFEEGAKVSDKEVDYVLSLKVQPGFISTIMKSMKMKRKKLSKTSVPN